MHPIRKAIVNMAHEENIESQEPEEFKVMKGTGVTGRL